MNKEEIENKIKEIFFDTGLHIGDGIGDICSGYDEEAMEEAKQKLSTLIQDERKDAVEGFVDSIKWKDTKEIDITDDLIDGRSLVNQVKEYLSSIGKEEK